MDADTEVCFPSDETIKHDMRLGNELDTSLPRKSADIDLPFGDSGMLDPVPQ